MSDDVTIVEVGARDGLQNEATALATADKVELIHRAVAAGARRIETVSFVHPKLVPQMADAEAVMEVLGPGPDAVSYIGLVLNERGLDRALDTAVDEAGFVVAATDGFSMANQNRPVADVMVEIEALVPRAREAGLTTSLTISVSFGCPFEGEVDPDAVVELARRGAAVGVGEISLGDTIGVAVPAQVSSVLRRVYEVVGVTPLRVHFHDTRNTAIANAQAALDAGVRTLDASVGGAGGCPFAPNATGNVATEDLVYLLDRSGYVSGLDGDALARLGDWLGSRLGRTLPSALARAGGFPPD
jgi:hydroxymethylglutaryl-CoA lyase